MRATLTHKNAHRKPQLHMKVGPTQQKRHLDDVIFEAAFVSNSVAYNITAKIRMFHYSTIKL